MQEKDAGLNENLPFEGVAEIVTMEKKVIAQGILYVISIFTKRYTAALVES